MGRASRDKGNRQREWRVVSVAPAYEISEDGLVRRCVRSPTRHIGHMPKGYVVDGYIKYKLATPRGKETHWAHRLVAAAFVGAQPSPTHVVAHSDADRANNHYSNLRWATAAENAKDAVGHGSFKGQKNGRARLSPDKVVWARKRRKAGHSIALIARACGVSHSAMRSALSGENWGHLHG